MPLQSPELPEVERTLYEHFDNYAKLRNVLRRVSTKLEEWAGVPMALDDMSLIVEPRYPHQNFVRKEEEADEKEAPPSTVINKFWSWRHRAYVIVYETDGKRDWGIASERNQVALQFNTLRASDAWGLEQEKNALHTLGGLVRHRQFKHYIQTGSFLETSTRSHVTYMFRRLRPTLALSTRGVEVRLLCAMCMHPIAYYEDSWAGAMTPTDDVVAHLMLMRGDEHMFWRRCSQHRGWEVNAGV